MSGMEDKKIWNLMGRVKSLKQVIKGIPKSKHMGCGFEIQHRKIC